MKIWKKLCKNDPLKENRLILQQELPMSSSAAGWNKDHWNTSPVLEDVHLRLQKDTLKYRENLFYSLCMVNYQEKSNSSAGY